MTGTDDDRPEDTADADDAPEDLAAEDDRSRDSRTAPDGDDPAQAGGEDDPDADDEGETWDVTLADLEDDPEPEPILPGSPEPEHVAFVLLGIALTLAVIYRLATLVGATIG